MKLLLAILAALLLFTACSGGAPVSETPKTPPAVEAPAENEQSDAAQPNEDSADEPVANADGFIFLYDGENVYMDENITDVLDALGEPSRTFEMPSCAFNGIDKIFSYPGANIHTYPADGEDFVHTINYMDDSIETAEGIRLGQSFDEVVTAYGSDYEEDGGYYIYYKGGTYVRFLFKDDLLIAITYGLKDYMEEI